MKAILAGSVVVGLLGARVVAERPVAGPPPESCGAPGLAGLIGQAGSVLNGMAFSKGTRIIRPGMAVTMDFRGDRLNIERDRADRILRVYCG